RCSAANVAGAQIVAYQAAAKVVKATSGQASARRHQRAAANPASCGNTKINNTAAGGGMRSSVARGSTGGGGGRALPPTLGVGHRPRQELTERNRIARRGGREQPPGRPRPLEGAGPRFRAAPDEHVVGEHREAHRHAKQASVRQYRGTVVGRAGGLLDEQARKQKEDGASARIAEADLGPDVAWVVDVGDAGLIERDQPAVLGAQVQLGGVGARDLAFDGRTGRPADDGGRTGASQRHRQQGRERSKARAHDGGTCNPRAGPLPASCGRRRARERDIGVRARRGARRRRYRPVRMVTARPCASSPSTAVRAVMWSLCASSADASYSMIDVRLTKSATLSGPEKRALPPVGRTWLGPAM